MTYQATAHTPESVLVTGGAGFIGSNFLLRMVPLHPKVRFVNLDALTYAGNLLNLQAVEDAPNYHFVHGDITDHALLTRLFETHGIRTVVHFAAESHVDRSIHDPLAFVRTNITGTATLLDVARAAWKTLPDRDTLCRFHHVSTDEVFGSLGSSGFFTEETPYAPRSPYSASKAGSDHLVQAYAHTFGLPVIISNCSNNYGPYQFPEKLIPLMIRNALTGAPLPVYGDGSNVRDWLHVEDHCTAIERILTHGRSGETYTVGGRSERTNLAVVQLLADLVDELTDRREGTTRGLIAFVTDRPGHDFRYAIDCSKLEQELGWQRLHTLESGLRQTVQWYIDHPEWIASVIDQSYLDYYQTQYAGRVSSSPSLR